MLTNWSLRNFAYGTAFVRSWHVQKFVAISRDKAAAKQFSFETNYDGKTLVHYNDVIMGAISSQITSLTIDYSIVYSDADERKHQSSASLAFVWGIRRGPVNSPHKWSVTRKMFPFDDVIMEMDCMSNYISIHFPSWRVNTCEANHNTVNHRVLFRITTYLHFAHASLSSIIASGRHMTFASTDSKHNWFPDWHHNGLNKGWFHSNIHVHARTYTRTHTQGCCHYCVWQHGAINGWYELTYRIFGTPNRSSLYPKLHNMRCCSARTCF